MIIPYTCARCGYASPRKSSMYNHLFHKKTSCPKAISDIELTDEIKHTILDNRVYRVPVVVAPPVINITTLNQMINYNNTINNLVSSMDPIDKLTKYINHKDIPLLEIGDSIGNSFVKKVEGLNKPTTDEFGVYDSRILDSNNILEVIDQVSSLANEHCENMNIIYEKKFNKLKLYDMGRWNDHLLFAGITTLLTIIQDNFFNVYECFLIRKIELSTLCYQDKFAIKEKLMEYYKFIGCFNIDPYVKNKNESEIIYNQDDKRCDPFIDPTDDNTALNQKYLALFTKVCDETKAGELNRIKTTVVDIITKNCLKNVDELNKKVVALFNMDDEFKQTIMPRSINQPVLVL